MIFTGNAKVRTLVFGKLHTYTHTATHIRNLIFFFFIKLIIYPAYLYAYIGEMGIVVGAHRLWAHKAYKATWQAKSIIMFLASMNFQNSVYVWVRDHRLVSPQFQNIKKK